MSRGLEYLRKEQSEVVWMSQVDVNDGGEGSALCYCLVFSVALCSGFDLCSRVAIYPQGGPESQSGRSSPHGGNSSWFGLVIEVVVFEHVLVQLHFKT